MDKVIQTYMIIIIPCESVFKISLSLTKGNQK